jgi:SAM-dependent methyltransferase
MRPKSSGHVAADYERGTRGLYQDPQVAARYVSAYEGPFRVRDLPQRVIVSAERRAVVRLLEPIADTIHTLVDVPCGTGKLHSVLERFPFRVIAADVSGEMLSIAMPFYARMNRPVRPARLDAAKLPFGDASIDAVVCLRLLHRVPPAIKHAVMAEVTRVARRHVLVSMGVVDSWQRIRLRLREIMTGVQSVPYPIRSNEAAQYLGVSGWEVTGRVRILPLLSAEMIYRLSRKE